MEIEDIRKLAKHLKNIRHGQRLREQSEDQDFFEDEYPLVLISDQRYQVRTGYVAGMLNSITQQLISDKPRVFTEARRKGTQEAADRIASLANKRMRILASYPDNPIESTFKRNWLRGEAWIYTPHNPDIAKMMGDNWREDNPDLLPVHFVLFDPMVVFSEPTEEIDGIPKQVVVSYKRMAGDIRANYPKWSGKKVYKDSQKIDFLLYFNSKFSYAEADDEPLFRNAKGEFVNGNGKRDNPYGLVPFAHGYSGWGVENEFRDPELLAYSRVRMIREKIIEDSTMASDFKRNIHENAWKIQTILLPAGSEVDADAMLGSYKRDPNTVNLIMMPPGGEMKIEESKLFDSAAFAYRDRVKADLMVEFPAPLQGIATGTSGRQDDVSRAAALTLYDCCLRNTAHLWKKALDMAFRICDKMGIQPKGMTEGDSESYSEIKVELRKESPYELSRRAAEGDMKYKDRTIDLEENHIKFQGYTKEESKQLRARMLAEQVMMTHPFFQDLIAQTIAKEYGLEQQFQQFMSQAQGAQGGIMQPMNIGSKGGESRIGNIQSAEGLMDLGRHEPRLPVRQ